MPSTHTQTYATPASRHIFIACLITTFTLALIEGGHLQQVISDDLSPQSKWLALLYAVAPILSLGILLGVVFETLMALFSWGKIGVITRPVDQKAAWAALPVGVSVLCITLGTILSFYNDSNPVNRSFSAYFWLFPSAALSVYIWHITRTLFGIVDRYFKRPVSLFASLILVLTLMGLFYLSLNEDLQTRVTSWPTLALIVIPPILVVGLSISLFSKDRLTVDRNLKRLGVMLGVLGTVGVVDLSEQMSRYSGVKTVLLEQCLMSQALIKGLQPFYDQDGDGNKTESIHKLADIYHSDLIIVGKPEAPAACRTCPCTSALF